MGLAYELLKYLEQRNIGVEGVDLFSNFEPNTPNNCIVFYDEPATTPPEASCLSVDVVGIQVLVRNENNFTAESKLKNIHKKIVGFGGSSLIDGGDVVSYITIETSPFFLGKDEDGRNKWAAHYNIRYETYNNENRL